MADLIEREPLLASMFPCAAKRQVEEAPAVNRWIPCSERFPEPFTLCIVFLSDGCVGLGEWDSVYGLWRVTMHQNGGRSYHVKHPAYWMPIPEIPEPPKKRRIDNER